MKIIGRIFIIFFRVIEKHANIEWSEKVLKRLNYYLKKTDLDALDKFNENQTMENYLQQSYSTLRGHGIHALTKLNRKFNQQTFRTSKILSFHLLMIRPITYA